MGLATAYGPFSSAVHHSFKPGGHRRKGYPSTAYQRSRRSLRELYGVMADPPGAGDRAISPAGSRMLVETPSQRDPAAAHEERGAVIFAGSVSMKFGE